MKLFDGGATALIIIGCIYFGDWLINKINPPPPAPKKCEKVIVVDGVTYADWDEKHCYVFEGKE